MRGVLVWFLPNVLPGCKVAGHGIVYWPSILPVLARLSKTLLWLLLLALPELVEAQFTYTTNSGAITITGYTGPGGTVVIPSTITDLPVTAIGNRAFQDCTNLTGVAIGDSVITIGASAFQNCTGLSSVTIGTSVNSIGDSAFWHCTSLTSVNIPSSVAEIGFAAFWYCTSLTAITVEAANVFYSSTAGVLFDKSQATLIQYPAGNGETSYTIPDHVTSIGYDAFVNCTSLTNVTMGNSVTNIGDSAFYECSSLTKIVIGDGVSTIEHSAFQNCTRLATLTIGNSVTNIGGQAFWYCTSLTSVALPDSVTSIGYGAFFNCYSLSNVMLGEGVTCIEESAFQNCAGLLSMTFPNSVVSIGGSAFSDCISLTSVRISSSVTSIGQYAFSDCPSLTTITVDASNAFYSSLAGVLFDKSQTTLIQSPGGKAGSYTVPDTVTAISDEAFSGCSSLTSVIIPISVTNIGSSAFRGSGLASVEIPNSVVSVGESAFSDCTNLTSVTMPGSVSSIGSRMFYSCTTLTNVTIGSGVSIIKEGAFSGCRSLTSVTIPNSVLTLGDFAFLACSGLRAVYFVGDAPSADSAVFAGDTTTAFYLPGAAGWGSTFAGLPTALWLLPNPLILHRSIGIGTNGFEFVISWATNLSVVVEACTNLATPIWFPVDTKPLLDGSSWFSDPLWTNYPGGFYRVRFP